MNELNSAVAKIKDQATREALMIIAKKLDRIESINPVGVNTAQITYAINRITDNL